MFLEEAPARPLDLPKLPAPSRRGPSKRFRIPKRLLGMLAGAGLVGGVGYFGILPAWSVSNKADRPLVAHAKRATLSITVSERGNVESCVTVDGICELDGGQNKISYLIPEGTKVKKGDVVVKFDGSEIQKNISQQEIKHKQATARIETTQQEMEIQRNKGESDIIAAEVELTLARLDLEKYKKGDYPAEIKKSLGEMELKKKDVAAEAAKLEQYQSLMKKGFKTKEDVRIQGSMLAAKELDYSSSELFLSVKKDYEYTRKTTEFSSKADQAQKKVEQQAATAKAQVSKAASEYEAAKSTAGIEKQQLDAYLTQKEKTVIKAEQEGIVAYSNERYWDPSSQVREGATVYSRQKIFSLPDMTRMQVKVQIHESLIKKIKKGQKAEVSVDAFPSVVFVGTVKSVSQLADSSDSWRSGGIKQYTTIVTIDDIFTHELKPGMTAEARIRVGELSNILVVPVQAIAEHKGDFFAFVEDPGGIHRRKVKIGENNEKLVEVLEGLQEGDTVALDAHARAAAEFKNEEAKEGEGEKPADTPSTTPQPKSP
ncbi:MAG: efflux RND transporter periplasmic adaptor subunit [Paludisphaera borealis]|uniref:efflux RND transporter periplasmic adaptor subunit n=1 Tax=Paludisphaera borealis TaxID=1387353 RepID=UPI00283C63D2|nr:efflux RND transporter periplasmic adaptor subunit [Paludisphaera borealis]MDR3623297.1 efflux RND transporter periplasmic adaptor subunit [Paludisphaera borealis]